MKMIIISLLVIAGIILVGGVLWLVIWSRWYDKNEDDDPEDVESPEQVSTYNEFDTYPYNDEYER